MKLYQAVSENQLFQSLNCHPSILSWYSQRFDIFWMLDVVDEEEDVIDEEEGVDGCC